MGSGILNSLSNLLFLESFYVNLLVSENCIQLDFIKKRIWVELEIGRIYRNIWLRIFFHAVNVSRGKFMMRYQAKLFPPTHQVNLLVRCTFQKWFQRKVLISYYVWHVVTVLFTIAVWWVGGFTVIRARFFARDFTEFMTSVLIQPAWYRAYHEATLNEKGLFAQLYRCTFELEQSIESL